MLFKNKDKEEAIPIKDLYVGILGYVYNNDRINSLCIISKSLLIIFKRKNMLIKGHESKEYIAENVFTKQTYYFWRGNNDEYDTIRRAVNSYAVYKYFPLEIFLKVPKMTLTKNELLQLYNGLVLANRRKEEKDIESEPITDDILQMILKSVEIVKEADINENSKNELLQKLEKLAEDYVKDMVQLEENKSFLSLENEYTIRMKYIRKLVDTETDLEELKNSKKHILTRELTRFKNNINK
jgi:hypothetical protein